MRYAMMSLIIGTNVFFGYMQAMVLKSEDDEPILQVDSYIYGIFAALRHENPNRASIEALLKGLNPTVGDINARDGEGKSLLHYFAALDWSFKAVNLARMLIRRGARVNITDIGGNTPLHQAINSQHMAYGKMLIEHGADKTLANETGFTALHLLIVNQELIKKMNTSIHICKKTFDVKKCKDDHLNCFTLLTEREVGSLKTLCFNELDLRNTTAFKHYCAQLHAQGKLGALRADLLAARLLAPTVNLDYQADCELLQGCTIEQLEKLYVCMKVESVTVPAEYDAQKHSMKLDFAHNVNNVLLYCDDDEGATPLHDAVAVGACHEILERLLALGAKRRALNKKKIVACELFKGFACHCSTCTRGKYFESTKLMLQYPFIMEEYIKSLIILRKIEARSEQKPRFRPDLL